MPIYEYTCQSCRTKFDRLVKSMNIATAIECPKCGSEKTSREFSVFAVGTEAGKSAGASSEPGMFGRCGGPGPCGMN